MTLGHVFVVAAGFGKRVIPKAPPFELALEGDERLVVNMGARVAMIEPAQSVTEAAAKAVEVADVTAGPAWPRWCLDTHLYRIPLPVGWTAHASGGVEPAVFDLVGPHDSMIYVQIPQRVPPLDAMVAHGQELVERGSFAAGDWVCVRYAHAGESYVQRHAVVNTKWVGAVVTLQCREDALSLVAPTHEFVTNELRGRGRE